MSRAELITLACAIFFVIYGLIVAILRRGYFPGNVDYDVEGLHLKGRDAVVGGSVLVALGAIFAALVLL
jgi:hypothetical protein